MPDPTFDDLPILRELGNDLAHAFHAHEHVGRSRRRLISPIRTRLGVLGAAAAIALAVAAFVLVVQGGSSSPPSATAALLRVASTAQTQPSSFPTDHQFTYVKTLSTDHEVIRPAPTTPLPLSQRGAPKATVTTEEQSWSSADRTGAVRFHVVSVRFPNRAARRLWERDGRPSFAPPTGVAAVGTIGHGDYLLGNLELTRHQLLAFTTNPRALYAKLYAAGGSAGEVFTEITDTLRNRPAPPRLRAALYRALALVPGVRLIGPVRDRLGRHGTAFALTPSSVEDEVIIDPATSQTLEERTIVPPHAASTFGVPAGTPISTPTYRQRAITNTIRTP